jgi:hypothetical protein
MPTGDRTGPLGLGPRSGHGAGYCGGAAAPGFFTRASGPGFGFGAGRGWRHRYWARTLPGWMRSGTLPTLFSESESAEVLKEILTRRVNELEQEISLAKQRLERLTREKDAAE